MDVPSVQPPGPAAVPRAEPDPVARADRFLVRGRLEQLPRRRADRDLVLRRLAHGVLPEIDEPVAERELTARLAEVGRDPVGLRRELVEAGLVTRTRDGAEYWRTRVTEFDAL
ncbi:MULTISPECIES: DUF2087 domain-containing protein [unclassified Cellulomonas]|uniref:DUF2087 domain-containing protein n=1 Tax=unclassified Cellulomonas TaxID=2620175 RepID=UPI0024B6D414|nr:DUF2087 domain-containing protein [Cellulomonas sp. ES6]WHP16813.1 DUF2087 domain-containing protein [Cellulomonas sp. ES6]